MLCADVEHFITNHSHFPHVIAVSIALRVALTLVHACMHARVSPSPLHRYKLSFCNTSLDYLNEQISLTEAGLTKAGLWDGVADGATAWAVEDYSALRALEHKSIMH